jgi:Capsular polysaccharide synthesis protein
LNNILPKKIWFLWLQGLDNAPLLVRKCYESWGKHNPDWELILLDESNIKVYMPFAYERITKQALSDVLRINLLGEYGGVWADATCFCTKPLDEWLPEYMSTGFFAFDRPGPDRMVSSWFLAATRYNYIASTYKLKVNAYRHDNPGMQFVETSRWRFLNKQLAKMNRRVWFSDLTTKILKVYPYFWFHFLFEQIYLHDKNFKEMWDATPKISADIPHKLFFGGMYEPVTEELKTHIDNKIAPVYKMTWKYDPPADIDGTAVGYLFAPRAPERGA